MKEKELLSRIALSLVPGIGPVNIRNLISRVGSAEEAFRQKSNVLLKIPGIGPLTVSQILKKNMFERAENEMEFISRNKLSVLFYTDPEYPQRLHHCNDAPALLYYKGSVSLNHQRMLAIVGTRSATEYGKQFTAQCIDALLPFDVLIVSGLAYGIDICAHRNALRAGVPTLGVVAHGLDRIYPATHAKFATRMAEHGGLLTEYPSETIPDRENFPSRNRIVAGICDAVLVVEASAKGGALITADIANSYNRDVFALPGRIDDPFSTGCNAFIRQNRAALITSAEDIVSAMSWDQTKNVGTSVPVQRSMFIQLNAEEEKICDSLKESNQLPDELSWKCGIPVSRLNAILLELELKGVVKSLPGKLYQIC